jgi:energy-coupling factor transport system ATP-binding protein
MLELRGVSYRYPGFARRVLEGVDLTIGDGEIVGLSGPNGSGKSTLCLLTAGVAPGSIGGELEGDVLLDGQSLRGRRPWELASSIGLVFSNPDAQRTRIASTVFEEVAFGPINLGLPVVETVARVRRALHALDMDHLTERDPGRLSGGETQLVAIASILAMEPRHLVLDEPVAELDPAGRELVAAALRRVADGGTGLLIAEHDRDLLAAVCTHLVGIEDGRILPDAGPSAARSRPAAFANENTQESVVIRCSGVRFEYPGGIPALAGVDLSIRAGETVAIVGRNGSGKTTLVRTFNGLLRPTAGEVEVAGRSAAGQRVGALARLVGLTFQDPNDQLFGHTCRDEVAFGARNVGLRGEELEASVSWALDAVGLAAHAGTNPFDLGPSKRRLLTIASVLAMRTSVVVLDEPTLGLDVEEVASVRAVVAGLAREGRTVVAISHDARFVGQAFARAVRLESGRIVADGAPARVLAEGGRAPE